MVAAGIISGPAKKDSRHNSVGGEPTKLNKTKENTTTKKTGLFGKGERGGGKMPSLRRDSEAEVSWWPRITAQIFGRPRQTAPELSAGNGKHLHCETKEETEFNPSHFLLRLSFVLAAHQHQETERRKRKKKLNAGAAVVLWQSESVGCCSLAGSEQHQSALWFPLTTAALLRLLLLPTRFN